MREVKSTISYRDKEYDIVFNLNVMEAIQKRFGTIGAWGELTDGKSGEVNIEALLFGFTEMINEGIEIRNDETGTNEPLLNSKKVARILSEIGIEQATNKINGVVIESVASEEKNV